MVSGGVCREAGYSSSNGTLEAGHRPTRPRELVPLGGGSPWTSNGMVKGAQGLCGGLRHGWRHW